MKINTANAYVIWDPTLSFSQLETSHMSISNFWKGIYSDTCVIYIFDILKYGFLK